MIKRKDWVNFNNKKISQKDKQSNRMLQNNLK